MSFLTLQVNLRIPLQNRHCQRGLFSHPGTENMTGSPLVMAEAMQHIPSLPAVSPLSECISRNGALDFLMKGEETDPEGSDGIVGRFNRCECARLLGMEVTGYLAGRRQGENGGHGEKKLQRGYPRRCNIFSRRSCLWSCRKQRRDPPGRGVCINQSISLLQGEHLRQSLNRLTRQQIVRFSLSVCMRGNGWWRRLRESA